MASTCNPLPSGARGTELTTDSGTSTANMDLADHATTSCNQTMVSPILRFDVLIYEPFQVKVPRYSKKWCLGDPPFSSPIIAPASSACNKDVLCSMRRVPPKASPSSIPTLSCSLHTNSTPVRRQPADGVHGQAMERFGDEDETRWLSPALAREGDFDENQRFESCPRPSGLSTLLIPLPDTDVVLWVNRQEKCTVWRLLMFILKITESVHGDR